jgi:hypothetical protein
VCIITYSLFLTGTTKARSRSSFICSCALFTQVYQLL